MAKRQETLPFAAQVAKLSKKKLAEQIGQLLTLPASDETNAMIDICKAEDDKRGTGMFALGLSQFNASIGLRQIGERTFDMRDPDVPVHLRK